MRLSLATISFRLLAVPWLVQVSLGESSSAVDSPAFLRTHQSSSVQDDSYNPSSFHDIRRRQQQMNQSQVTPAKNPQLALNWPRLSTWSSLSLPIQLIANSPLISTGFIAISITTILALNGQLNFYTIIVLVSAFFSFIGGVLELLNLIITESSPAGKAPRTNVATAIFLGGGVFFKYIFLFFRFERPTSNRASLKSTRDSRSLSSTPFWATPTWDQLGPSGSGKILKFFVLFLITLIGVLEIIWKIGLVSAVSRFRLISVISAGLQMLLLLLMSAKTVFSVLNSRSASYEAYSAVKGIGPVLVGHGIGLGVQVMAFEITAFVETPLGRFMDLIQIYFYIVDAVTHCAYSAPNRNSLDQLKQSADGEKGLKTFHNFSSFDERSASALASRKERLASFDAQTSPPPVIKSIPFGRPLPDISTLSYPGGNRRFPSISGLAQQRSREDPSQTFIASNLNHGVAVEGDPAQEAKMLIPLVSPAHTTGSDRLSHSLNPARRLSNFEAIPSESQFITRRTSGSTKALLGTMSGNSSRNGRPASSAVDDLGPVVSAQPSTIFSRYHSYDFETPPPLPASHTLPTLRAEKPLERNIRTSPVTSTTSSGPSGPPPSIPLPPTPSGAQFSPVPILSANRETKSFQGRASIPSSTFSLSHMIPIRGEDFSLWGIASPSTIGDFPVQSFSGYQESSPAPHDRAKEISSITPPFASFLDKAEDVKKKAREVAPQRVLSDDLGDLDSGFEELSLSPIHDRTLLASSTTFFELIRPGSPSVVNREPNNDGTFGSDSPLSHRFWGNNLDVTSFIGGLTFPGVSQIEKDRSVEDSTMEMKTFNKIGFPSNEVMDLKTIDEDSENYARIVSGTDSMMSSSSTNSYNPTSSLQIIDSRGLPIIREFEFHEPPSSPDHDHQSRVESIASTDTLQIIDSRGLPIIREFELNALSPDPQKTPVGKILSVDDVKEKEGPNSLSTDDQTLKPSSLTNLLTVPTPVYNNNPILSRLPRTLSNSSLFQSSTAFENPRPAPRPPGT